MSPDEIKAARRELGFSTSQMAEWLGLELPNGERRIRDLESGRLPISGPARRAIKLALALKRLIAADLALPNGGSEWDAAMDQAEAELQPLRAAMPPTSL